MLKTERMRIGAITLTCTISSFTLWAGAAHGKGRQKAGGAPDTAVVVSAAPTDKAAYWANADIQATWKDLEARQVINKRVLEGGRYSINIRIVKTGDAPLVHSKSCDMWIVQSGTATAITGGTLINPQERPNADDIAGSEIAGGTEQPLVAGDILYVPPGVPHGFKDVKGFRAFLIRFDTK